MISRLRRVGSKVALRIQNLIDNDFEPIYICGVAGSGTTLLSALLHQRYQIAVNARESARWAPPNSVLHIKPIADYPNLKTYFDNLSFQPTATPEAIRNESIKLYRGLSRWPKLSSAVLDKAPNTHLLRAAQLHAAFPESKFILIIRDPVSNIEGLRRKWPLFDRADLEDVCNFWMDVHKIFLSETMPFRHLVRVATYEQLVDDTDAAIVDLASFLHLDEREDYLAYQDIDSSPGKGLRNVKQGEIRIDPSANADAVNRLPAGEVEIIHRLAHDFYRKLSGA